MVVTNTSQRINPKKTSLKPYVLRVLSYTSSVFYKILNRVLGYRREKSSLLEIPKESFFYHMISVNQTKLTNTKTMLLKLRESMTLCFCSSNLILQIKIAL